MEIDQFAALVRSYMDAGKSVCIMCFERDPADCHRGVLAERWKKRRRARVEHLGAEPRGEAREPRRRAR